MTKVQSYPQYKESGAQWLGLIPAAWDAFRIKMSVETSRNGIWGQDPSDGDLPIWCVRVADFNRKSHTVEASERTMRSITSDELISRRLNRGDLLLEKSGGGENSPVGFVVRFDHDDVAVCSNFVAKIQLRPGMDSRFWTYVHATTYSVRLTQRSIKQTSGIQNLDQTSYFNELAPFPPLETQSQIADFLDRETAQIDDLISKQERLLALLAERRQAIVIQAVTKGLDLTTPTKPSGIPWLGDVPAHWTIQRASWLFQTISSGTTPPSDNEEYYDGETNWVTTGELRETEISSTSKKVTQKALNDLTPLRMYSPGALLVAMYGATIGRLGILAAPATTNQACCVFDVPLRVTTRFAFFSFMAAKEHLLVLASGGGQPNINQEKLRALRLPVPPIGEQQAIVEEIDLRLGDIDALSERSEKVIRLLRERRTALISAVVTGKIDVRERAA